MSYENNTKYKLTFPKIHQFFMQFWTKGAAHCCCLYVFRNPLGSNESRT